MLVRVEERGIRVETLLDGLSHLLRWAQNTNLKNCI